MNWTTKISLLLELLPCWLSFQKSLKWEKSLLWKLLWYEKKEKSLLWELLWERKKERSLLWKLLWEQKKEKSLLWNFCGNEKGKKFAMGTFVGTKKGKKFAMGTMLGWPNVKNLLCGNFDEKKKETKNGNFFMKWKKNPLWPIVNRRHSAYFLLFCFCRHFLFLFFFWAVFYFLEKVRKKHNEISIVYYLCKCLYLSKVTHLYTKRYICSFLYSLILHQITISPIRDNPPPPFRPFFEKIRGGGN